MTRGSASTFAYSVGWRAKSTHALARSFVTVSLPAEPIRLQKPMISPSVRRVGVPSSSSTSAVRSALTRPSSGRRRRFERNSGQYCIICIIPIIARSGMAGVPWSRSSETSIHSRSCRRSASGTPRSVKITSIGSGIDTSRTKSPPPSRATVSRSRDTVARMNGSSDATRRGVNARLTSFRSRSWRGGSWKMIIGRVSKSRGSMRSSVVPSAELYVSQSSDAASTSR